MPAAACIHDVIGCNTATSQQQVESQIAIEWSSSFNLCGLLITFETSRRELPGDASTEGPCCDVVVQTTVVMNAKRGRSGYCQHDTRRGPSSKTVARGYTPRNRCRTPPCHPRTFIHGYYNLNVKNG